MADDKKRDDFAIEMGDRGNNFQRPISPPRHNSAPSSAAGNNPIFPVLSYCASSILMTVTNKFVLSGLGFNLNFFLLSVQVRIPHPKNGEERGEIGGYELRLISFPLNIVDCLCRGNSRVQVVGVDKLSGFQFG